jgi:hypothetical protein
MSTNGFRDRSARFLSRHNNLVNHFSENGGEVALCGEIA